MDPDALLSDDALQAAVNALAARNAHHLEQMDAQEQADALAHWRELALDVLAAARSVVTGDGSVAPVAAEGPGRAVIVIEDAGDEELSIHASFHPELQEGANEGEVIGTPAQVTAVMMLQDLAGEGEEE